MSPKRIFFNDKCLIYLLSSKVCGLQYELPPLINLDLVGIITRKIIGKQKEGRNICSHLFLSIFLQMIIKVHNDHNDHCSITLIDKTEGLIPLEERNTGEEF